MRDAATQTEAVSFGLAKFSTTTTTNHIAQVRSLDFSQTVSCDTFQEPVYGSFAGHC
jgi:hypothetical protein